MWTACGLQSRSGARPMLTFGGSTISPLADSSRRDGVGGDALDRCRRSTQQHEVSDRSDAEFAVDALSASRRVVRMGGFESEEVGRRHDPYPLAHHRHTLAAWTDSTQGHNPTARTTTS